MDWYYKNREERTKWISERFKNEIKNSKTILDIGCDRSLLKNYLTEDTLYTGIDICGNPDLLIDLDKIDKLPFDNEIFDTVICLDVLEHLENIHLILDEICRVSRRYVIITLPNPTFGIIRYLIKKRYSNNINKSKQFGKYMKYYGLPLEKPDDRHRWFFSYDDAVDFIAYRSKKSNFIISKLENNLMYEKFLFPKNIAIKLFKYINHNFAYRDAIFLLERI